MHVIAHFELALNYVPISKSKPNLKTYALGAQGKALCDIAKLHFCDLYAYTHTMKIVFWRVYD